MLTGKQEKFCLEFAKSGNERKAYIKAGYKAKSPNSIDSSASRLLKNAKVQKRLEELRNKVAEPTIADIKEMQEKLTEIIREQTKEEVVVSEGTGDGCSEVKIIEKKPAIKDVVSAINTLGKMQGAFIEKTEMNMDIAPIVINNDVNE